MNNKIKRRFLSDIAKGFDVSLEKNDNYYKKGYFTSRMTDTKTDIRNSFFVIGNNLREGITLAKSK